MKNFLGNYRGAAVYEVEEFTPPEGQKLSSKIIAQAKLPDQENIKIDFVEKAETQKKAREKIRNTIDSYLDKHEINQFTE